MLVCLCVLLCVCICVSVCVCLCIFVCVFVTAEMVHLMSADAVMLIFSRDFWVASRRPTAKCVCLPSHFVTVHSLLGLT